MSTRRWHKWTAEEEETLRAGVAKHGVSSWSIILNDSEFAPKLHNRTSKILKDKWRNMNISKSKRCIDTDTGVDVMTPKANATSSSDHPSISDSAMKEELEKLYRIKDVALGTDEPAPEQRPMQTASHETVDSAAETAAQHVAEAGNKDLIAALAVQESERVSQRAEDAEVMLAVAEQLFAQCELNENPDRQPSGSRINQDCDFLLPHIT